jgi:hypothetical protein
MKHAFQMKVWWPLKIRQFDEAGKESEGNALVHLTVLTGEQLATFQSTAMQAMREGMVAQQLRALPPTIGQPELAAAREQEIADLERGAQAKGEAVLQVLRDNVHDWRRFQVDGTELAFSAETFEDLLRYQHFQQAVSTALREAASGARAKN